MAVNLRYSYLTFGDLSVDTHDFIADFCRSRNPSVLANSFIAQATAAVQQEIDALPRNSRPRIPPFRTLGQLNKSYHGQPVKHAGIENALLCIAQLADYINHAEKDPGDLVERQHTFVVGFGSGLFAAVAASMAPSPSFLIPIAVAAVNLAFRTGSLVSLVAQEISAATDKSAEWAYTVSMSEADGNAILNEFHEKENTPKASRAYVSGVLSESSIEISGPPATLVGLAKALGAKPTTPAHIYGPYRAKHLHGSVEVARIIGIDDAEIQRLLEKSQPHYKVMSSTAKWLTEKDARSRFVEVAHQCLCEVFDVHKALGGCYEAARRFRPDEKCLVLSFGSPAPARDSLIQGLNTLKGAQVVVEKPAVALMPPDVALAVPGSIGRHGSSGKCKLAVVGMAGRFPDAASHQLLWELLLKGLDVHRVVPPDRFPAATHCDPSGKLINTSHTPYGCWIENPGLFDPRFFNMSPREAFQTDPMQRMAIMTAYEAMEMSGYVPNRTNSTRLDRIGTFYGQTSDDWREVNAAQEVDTYFITGGVRAFGPGRINYHFGFSGPSFNVDTACSSSAAALHVACTSLWAHEVDMAIVGGLSCMTNSDIFSGLSRGQFLSKTGSCKTFDNAADGYCRADGCASVIVKRLDDAMADRDNVLAVILGTLTNHSADAISITHPHGPTQSVLSSAILDQAGVDPLDVDYVEMHGTGTQAGDGTEMVSVTDVFAPATRRRPADRPLYLGSIKANVGHGEAASGVTALCKVLMMLKENLIPPHVGIKKDINKTFPKDLSERNVNIAFHVTPFKRNDGRPRRVFVNNFSAAGGNTGLLLEDGPRYPPAAEDPRSVHVVTVTAKSKAAMIRNAERLVAWIDEHRGTPLSSLAYTTTARRIQHYWRMNVAASSLEEARRALVARLQESFTPISSNQPDVAFVFTGQGSHYAGLGKDLYAHFSVFRSAIDEFDKISHEVHGFPSFMPLIDGSEPDVANLSPVVLQIGLCCFEMALARLWGSWGVKPAAVIGHSLGEYPALYVAGALSASDTIYLVGVRAQLLVSKCTAGTHAMLAAQGSVSKIMAALGDGLSGKASVACINGPDQTVLSGAVGDVAAISDRLARAGIKSTPLQVPFAFHSDQVDAICNSFEAQARSVQFHAPHTTVISPLLGKLIKDQSVDAVYLRKHAREAVNFHGGLLAAMQADVVSHNTIWIEVGPHPVCCSFVRATFGASARMVPSLRRNEDTYKTLSSTLCTLHSAGVDIDWDEYHRDFAASTRLLDLPSYSFDNKNYWLQYEGDWLLTKNRGAQPLAGATASGAPTRSRLSTPSVHEVVKEEIKDGVVTIETETNLSREDTRPIVMGHLCNGAPLCPSTLYADICLTIAHYGYKLVKPDAVNLGVNVSDVEVPRTLIFDEKLPAHVLRCRATIEPAAGVAKMVFSTGEGGKRVEHAYCKVSFGNTEEWALEFERSSYLIQGRIDSLLQAEREGRASKVGRGLAYKLFSALVDYGPWYRGMEEVVLDSTTCEATAKVVLQEPPAGEDSFYFCPYWIDSCCHISGFIVNGTDAVDSREQVYISHGWGSLRFVEKMDRSRTYRSYIRMQPIRGPKMWAGDAWVFDDAGKVVGLAGDVRFQAIPRKVLNTVLPPRGAAAAGMAGGAAAARPAAKKGVASKGGTVTQPSAAPDAQSSGDKAPTPSKAGSANQGLKSVTAVVLDILAKEIGCSNDELADNINFGDLGVDSLMALTVSGRMREELELDIDSNAFVDHPTIGAFKMFLGQFESAAAAGAHEQVSSPATTAAAPGSSHSQSISPAHSSGSSTVTTSASTSPGERIKTPDGSDAGSVENEGETGDHAEMRQILRATIAEAMAVEVDEIIAAPDLASLGMDSLMSLTILGTLRERTGLDLDSELFMEHPTLAAVEKALGISEAAAPKPAPRPRASSNNSAAMAVPPRPLVSEKEEKPAVSVQPRYPKTINTHPGNTTATIDKPPRPAHVPDPYPHRVANATLLQGKTSSPRFLWMIPDGSGSPTSYTDIDRLSPDWAVWGLFSPFMRTPHEYKCGVYGIATKFIEQMRSRQPHGPYSIAGWSAGGIIAFEIVQQLTRAGEKFEHLILIDAPCPVTIEPLPKTLHQWFASIGLLGQGDDDQSKRKNRKVPEWLLPHFAASVTALSNYWADPVPKKLCPRVVMAIWCEDGVCKLPSDPRPDPYPDGHARFLLDNRTDFGPNRWDEYLDEEHIVCRHMPGNHFSMMHGQLAVKLGSFMREAINM